MMARRLAAVGTVNCMGFLLVTTVLLLAGAKDARGHVGQPGKDGPVRTVMDLMEVMLSQDILDMLKNGGFDFRQPARIFLPPKFYSSVPLDRGHMSPDEVLGAVQGKTLGESHGSGGGKTDHHRPSGAGTGGGSSINLISYSDGKVTASGGPGGVGGRWATAANKGSETLGKNVGTNANGGRANFPAAPAGRRTEPTSAANEPRHSSLTTSITDQTVSQNVGRTLPTSGRTGGAEWSTTDRLRSALPGEPDVDYPILGSVPSTGFSCDGRHHGYYADVETRCQAFRVCANTDSTGRGFGFLCPNGTLFNQRHLVCDWYMHVRCEDSENFYRVNEDIGRMAPGRSMVSSDRQEMMKVVMSMVTYPMRSLMEQMDGVGVIEERIAGLQEPREVPVGPTAGQFGVMTPETGLQAPFSRDGNYPSRGTTQDNAGSVNGYTPNGGFGVRPAQDQPYTPQLDEVYVSNLGTLSTDPDSGFDRSRSMLVSSAEGSLSQVSQTPQGQAYRVSSEEQYNVPKAIATDVQLIKADLVKTWNGQPNPSSLRLTPVPQVPQQPTFNQPLVERVSKQPNPQTLNSVPGRGSILPPTGVLPPSGLTRTVTMGSFGQASGVLSDSVSSAHRFAPVRKVLPIQKVTVVPEYSYHTLRTTQGPAGTFYNAQGTSSVEASNPTQRMYQTPQTSAVHVSQQAPHVLPEYLPYTGVRALYSAPEQGRTQPYAHHSGSSSDRSTQQVAAFNRGNFPHGGRSSSVAVPQQVRRQDDGATVRTSSSPRRLQTSTVLQVVPSLSFYLNDAEEKLAFDEAVRQGLFDERRRRTFSSYEVPLGSVGQLASPV